MKRKPANEAKPDLKPFEIRDRVREFKRVAVADLMKNPLNWRLHDDDQRQALDAMLRDVGFAGAVLTRELEDGTLQLIDGHLRGEVLPQEFKVPVLVLDVTKEEADRLLLTYDPISAMAKVDGARLAELISGADFKGEGISLLLDGLKGMSDLAAAVLWKAGEKDIKEAATDPEAGWPEIRLTVPPDLFQRWNEVTREHQGDGRKAMAAILFPKATPQ